MAFDFSALEGAIKLVTDAVNDTTTAFGGESEAWTEYGNLLPDLLSIAPKVGDIPNDVKKLNPDEVTKLVDQVADGLKLEGDKAKSVVGGVVTILHDILGHVDDVVALSKSIKSLKDGGEPVTPKPTEDPAPTPASAASPTGAPEAPTATDGSAQAPAEPETPPSNGMQPVSE